MKNRLKLGSLLVVLCASCDSPQGPEPAENRFIAPDELQAKVAENIEDFTTIATIDHARLAAEVGVQMPPSIVTIFGDPKIHTPLIKLNPRIGLDLPLKTLVYEETGEEVVAYADSKFVARRHGIGDAGQLKAYDAAMQTALRGLPEELISPVVSSGFEKDYGIVELTSDFPFPETIENLKKAVMSQGDTVWFGDVDYQADAAGLGEKIPDATLLLFGGPKPGGVAMADFPRLGLDAFCQKLLVYEDKDGAVRVIFNDIVDFSKLHYKESIEPHAGINARLTQTFKGAVTKGG